MAYGAQARHCADGHFGHVLDQYRGVLARFNQDRTNVVRIAQQAKTANSVLLHALRDITAPCVLVAAAQCVEQVLVGEAVGAQFFQVGLYFVLFDEAAHGDDVGHAWHLAQVALDHPVLQGAQLGGGFALALEAKANHLTYGCRVGGYIHFRTLGQVHAL